jgi:hypothetical protein
LTAVVLALGCLLQGPWNSLPVIDCNEGPILYGADLRLKNGQHLVGYVALAKPLDPKTSPKLELFKPDCGLTVFRDPDVASTEGDPDDDCLFDEYATQNFQRAWLPREAVLNLSAAKIKALALKPLAWDGISTERFLILSRAERELLAQGGPRVDLTDYQGSGRLTLAGGAGVKEDALWDMAKAVAGAVQRGGKPALIAQKQELLKEHIVLLFYPDVEP